MIRCVSHRLFVFYLRWLDGEAGGYRYDHASASELIEDGYGMMIVNDHQGYKVRYDGNGAPGFVQ